MIRTNICRRLYGYVCVCVVCVCVVCVCVVCVCCVCLCVLCMCVVCVFLLPAVPQFMHSVQHSSAADATHAVYDNAITVAGRLSPPILELKVTFTHLQRFNNISHCKQQKSNSTCTRRHRTLTKENNAMPDHRDDGGTPTWNVDRLWKFSIFFQFPGFPHIYDVCVPFFQQALEFFQMYVIPSPSFFGD